MRRFLVLVSLLLLCCPAAAQINDHGSYPLPPVTPTHIPAFTDTTGLPLSDSGIGVSSGRLTGLTNPSGAQDAATKSYVDANAGSLIVHSAARVASTANLNATYANGASGVGATLTNAGALAALVIDGVTISNGDRILYKDATTQFQNGVYTQTTTGTGSVAWVLTRATDFDQVSATEVGVGALFNVTSGTVNASTAWLESGQGPFTIGATAIVFSQFGQQGAINCSQLPALTGDATTSVGTCATTVAKVDAVTYPAGPAANTVPVVTSATSGGTVTYEAVPNAALANSSITVNTVPCTLGSTCTITAGLSGLTNNVITKGTSGSTIGSSSITDNGTTISTSEPISAGGIGVATGDTTQSIPNNTTATVLHQLAILASGTYQATAALTTSTTNVIGICDGGCGGTGSATIAWGGIAQCIFDGATTAGHWVVASTTVAADCHDAGASVPGTVQVLGQVTSTNGAGGTFTVDMNPVGTVSALNTKFAPGGTSGQIQYNNAGAFGGFTATGDWTINTSTGVDVVGKVNGVTHPSAPSANTVPVVTSATSGGTVTYEAVPNAALANSSMTIAGHSVALGGTQTLACADLTGVAASCSTDTTIASNISSGTLAAARLPNPSATTLGGVESIAPITHAFVTSISTSGVPALAQPAAADITGLATTATSNALSALATQSANTVVANVTASTAVPTAAAMPSCTDTTGNHLNYTAGTGFSCGTSGGEKLISSQTVSAVSAIRFINLTNTFNSVFLNCESLVGSSSSGYLVQVGEGSGAAPTWETGAHYTITSLFLGTSDPTPQGSIVPGTGVDLTNANAGGTATTNPSSIKLWLDSIGSSTLPKVATNIVSSAFGGGQWYSGFGSAYWNLDTNPVVGLQVIPASGTITGTCSLYGLS